MCQDYIYDKDMEQIAKDEQRKAWKMQGMVTKPCTVPQPPSHMHYNDDFIGSRSGAGICETRNVSIVLSLILLALYTSHQVIFMPELNRRTRFMLITGVEVKISDIYLLLIYITVIRSLCV